MKQTGLILREHREKSGLTIQEVSLALKINAKTIKAMEDGDLAQLPPRTFLRGFVHSYAQYLKLDLDHLMSMFNEDFGVSHREANTPAEPQPTAVAESPVLAPKTKFSVRQPSKLATFAVTILAIAIVVVIIVVKKTIDKYQRESQVVAPPASVHSIHPQTNAVFGKKLELTGSRPRPGQPPSPVANERRDLEKKPAGPAATLRHGQTTITAKTGASMNAHENALSAAANMGKSTAASARSAIVGAAKPATAARPTSARVRGANPMSMKSGTLAASKKPVALNGQAPEKSLSKTAGLNRPQEVIIQALGPVTVRVAIDGGAVQVLQLKSNQIRTIKAAHIIKLGLSDGGAVSLIYNGRDAGVPGNLGVPMHLSFPRKQ